MRTISRVLAVLILAPTLALTTVGCLETPVDEVPDWVPEWAVPDPTVIETGTDEATPSPAHEDGTDAYGRALPGGTHGHAGEVLLLGRSVMNGWFDHWEWGEQNGVLRDGWALYYGELESPPAIADSARAYIDAVPSTTIVCFKLCFVDFWAESPEDIASGLQENLGYVQDVVRAAQEGGTPLVVMTALPETASNTNASLLELHRDFGDEVRELADTTEGVYVFDLNDVLTDQTGALYRGFAVAPDDAHLNDVAYLELDEAFFAFLADSFGAR